MHRIPFAILTGFLGGGKTTLLTKLLTQPQMGDTLVVINEFGEVGLDHLIVRHLTSDVVELSNGCLCCISRTDIVNSLRNAVEDRDAGRIRHFDRVVLETSGLADPAQILATLTNDPFLDSVFALQRVVTVVDAIRGLSTIETYPEATAQLLLADTIVITKVDLVSEAEVASLREALHAVRPDAELMDNVGIDLAATLFSGDRRGASPVLPSAEARHAHGIVTFTFALTRTPSRLDFSRSLGSLAMARGEDVLRVKAMLRFQDVPHRVALVHAVQHTLFPPDWLEEWPDTDLRYRMVVIGRNLDAADLCEHFSCAGAEPWLHTDLLRVS